jgi:hypothetical protein
MQQGFYLLPDSLIGIAYPTYIIIDGQRRPQRSSLLISDDNAQLAGD